MDKPMPQDLPADPMDRLIAIMAWLRHPERGCPWDREQDFASIAPYTIEEAYEVADAINRRDMPDLREELGDLLLQVVYHARMAEEEGAFAFRDVAIAISRKMVDRHPHVFGSQSVPDAAAQTAAWEATKATERAAKAKPDASALDGVALALPALLRAEKLQKRAAQVGFDWGAPGPVIDKIEEEIGEVRAEIAAGASADRLRDEIGDVLFAVANLARHLSIDPEAALRATNDKFTRRFRHIERRLKAQGRSPEVASLAEMEALWVEAKRAEKP
jgi:MazG family protein